MVSKNLLLTVAWLLVGVYVSQTCAATVCLLKLAIDQKQSLLTGSGTTQAPFEGIITKTKSNVTGYVWLRVPASSSCPPKLTAESAQSLLEQSSIEVPIGSDSMTMVPKDLKSNVTTDDLTNTIASYNLDNLGLGLTGTEPLGPGSVTVGQGTVKEAQAAAQDVCSQLLLLGGTLDLSSKISGKRTADMERVAFNRTIGAGISVEKDGTAVKNATLFLKNVTLFLNVSPETKEGTGTPGVEFSRALYTLSGDVVASADLSKASSWQSVPDTKVAWADVARKDAPVVIGAARPGKPRYIGSNSTVDQQCKPTRNVNGAAASPAAAPATPKSSTGSSRCSLMQVVLVAAMPAAFAALLV